MKNEFIERYEQQLRTPVDYGSGPRMPMRKKNTDALFSFEEYHTGAGFTGRIPLDELFVASDHHFGHKNIIKYANRPFADVDEMHRVMIENHNSVVGVNDYCIFGGDIGFGSVKATNKILNQMNGFKIFIIGNHDFERDSSIKKYDVDEVLVMRNIYLPFGQEREYGMVVSHYPLDGLPKDVINIHGHIHDNMSDNPQHINVCVEHWDYTPIPMTRIVEIANMRYEEAIG